MRVHAALVLIASVFCSFEVNAGTYDSPTSKGVQWLTAQQNLDGSWGNLPELQVVYTSAAV
jgi:prenyltransferase beta subunit